MAEHTNNPITAGLTGLATGDALGVPVEFRSREYLEANPVQGMIGEGTYSKPAGTWSDDTSMTLALADSLSQGKIDYFDIMDKFASWYQRGAYTADGETFDVGNTTKNAIRNYLDGLDPLSCGGFAEQDNGNGSLMRILPLAFFLHARGGTFLSDQNVSAIHKVSALTHAHPRSQVACVLYCAVAARILEGAVLDEAIQEGFEATQNYYLGAKLLDHYGQLHTFQCSKPYDNALFVRYRDLRDYPRDAIRSSGYVVDTLDATFWCLLNHEGYRETVLAAVNLGEDTDTTAAVCGGLAGLYYGFSDSKGVPSEWIEAIQNRDLLFSICNKLEQSFASR